jgi:outer membrane protein insertion porin family
MTLAYRRLQRLCLPRAGGRARAMTWFLAGALAWFATPSWGAEPDPNPAGTSNGVATPGAGEANTSNGDGDVPPLTGSTDTNADANADPEAAGEQDEQMLLPTLPATDLEAADGLKIASIEVTGLRRITPGDIASRLKLKAGDTLDGDTLSQDVRTLWQTGFFDDVEVDLRKQETTVTLRFLVKERPSVKAVEFEGNAKIKDDDLAEAVGVKPNTTLSRPELRKAVQKIRDKYAEQGYFLAEASHEILPGENNEVTIRFDIKENSQVSVKRITFIGNESISGEELRQVMFTGNPGLLSFGSGGPFRQDAFERDIAMVSAMYYDRGFLQVQVNTPRVMLTPDRSGIEVSITINEGPRYKIRQLRVFEVGTDGQEVEPLVGRRALRMMLRAESGDYFNRAQLLEDLSHVRGIYRDKGYANVQAEPQTAVDPERQEVDLILPVVRGPLVKFERIEIRGNTKTRDKVIRRELEIAEGQVFSETKLDRSRRRVTALGYFERADFSTEQGSAPDRLVVYVEVTEKPTGTFQIGAGFSSIESFLASAQVQQANLFGNGQSLSLQAQISGIRSLINLRLVEPYFLDSKFSTSLSLFDTLQRYADFSQRSRGGNLTIGYPLIEPELSLSLTYNLTYDAADTSSYSPFLLGAPQARVSTFSQLPLANLFNSGITSSLRPAITLDTRDNRLFPTSGIYLSYGTEWALAEFGSQNQYVRHRYTGRFYLPLWWKFVLKLNTEAGLVTSPSQQGVPIFARFFLGGIMDVRGFYYRTLGPRMPLTETTDPNSNPIANGARIGGNLMYYQNLELEFPIFEPVGLKGVVFTDLGNTWNLEGNYCDAAGGASLYPEVSPCFSLDSLAAVRTSWGFGFRWFSPMGPLRFEWGFPFAPLPFEEKMRFEFTIGNFF